MKIKLITAILSLFTFGLLNSASAETDISQMSEIDRLCVQFPKNSICEDKESYISLEKWEKHKTVCSLAIEWNNQERKCKLFVEDNELIIYVENGTVYEALPNILKTEVIKIPLNDIFTFNTQWWLADVTVTNANSNDNGTVSTDQTVNHFAVGSFTDLKIGFISDLNSSEHSTVKFITVSAKNLHQVLERMESWRYYLPDLAAFEKHLKPKPISSKNQVDVSKNIAKLEDTNECLHCDLRSADLTGMNLENANLQGANLQGANLEEVNLEKAYLIGANLNKTNLNSANLENTIMMFASLIEASLVEADLKGANLQNANLESSDLSEAQLKANKFNVTYLKNANLEGANLSNADLRCANLQSASLKKANLTNVDLGLCKHSSISNSFELSYLRLNDQNVSYSFLNDLLNVAGLAIWITEMIKNPAEAILTLSIPRIDYSLSSNLSNANFDGANLTNANLNNAQLTDANLSNVILVDTKLSANNLSNANFINTDVSKVNFKNPLLICEAMFSDDSIYEEYCQEEEAANKQ
ncbi:putative Pentapeptide repeat protein [Hyella patelloides LEGE 07179]|uniref:Putative Pentapeptide repeat protein n=1 Tax=Hyella patelloides LEGE 07179 TaxID=945734 RepID=A0A563VNX9_9CYAN|nr:pentapeptide repeat-containing protein [Hyella patelloides]VEP13133.1 putative Pentapeptide repeat protein [Hyella patelloides LEGE 07179]